MDKSADAFRTIGEMADSLGVKTHILRYWEEQFPMLKPLKRAGGRRHYRTDDVALLHAINRLLNNEGYTIKGARKFLAGGQLAASPQPASETATPPVSAPNPSIPVPAMSANNVTALRAIRDRLSAALMAA